MNKKKSPMSQAQKRLWYDDQINEKASSRNTMFVAFELKGQVNQKVLNKVFTSLTKKHDALRFSFIEENQGASLRANYVGGKRKPRIHLLYNAVNSYLSLCTEKVTILE